MYHRQRYTTAKGTFIFWYTTYTLNPGTTVITSPFGVRFEFTLHMYFESKHLVTFPRRNYFCLLTLIQATQQYYAILHDTVLRTNANVHCTRSNHAPLPLPSLNPPPHHHDACDSNNKTATACRIYNTAELLLAARQHGQKKFRGAKEGRQIDGKSGHSAA